MDSFYDAPRQPPVPTAINRVGRIPVVPEVSVVENSFFAPPKAFNLNVRPQFDKPNSFMNSSLKKHVRFKNPCPQTNLNADLLRNDKENAPQPLKTAPDLNGKTFKQIYMANVPDRHLDLSVFEAPGGIEGAKLTHCDKFLNSPSHNYQNDIVYKPLCREEPEPCQIRAKTDKFSSSQAVWDRQYDVLSGLEKPELCQTIAKFDKYSNTQKVCNHQYDANVLRSVENTRPLYTQRNSVFSDSHDGTKAAEICNEIAKPSDEPTIKDLYKIIQQQNEQIMLLQRQVNNLKSSLRQPEPEPMPFDNPQEHRNSPTKKGLFSIDFQTTSFEVSFRPPPGKFRKQNELFEPKIQEITECDNSKENQDLSLRLEESLHVKDSYLSAVPSIQINMDEYHSSDEDESSVNIGITFYKDLMDQVNNVLKKMQVQSECQMASKKKDVIGPTMTAVKQATLQHLKSIGVNLTPIQETNEISGGSDCENISDPTEVSFAVKQLLMKYLPDDKLTKAINMPKEAPVKKKKKFKPAGSEFSFATLEYLKKYNLIDNSRKLPELEIKGDSPKILDVTALKRQPKLL